MVTWPELAWSSCSLRACLLFGLLFGRGTSFCVFFFPSPGLLSVCLAQRHVQTNVLLLLLVWAALILPECVDNVRRAFGWCSHVFGLFVGTSEYEWSTPKACLVRLIFLFCSFVNPVTRTRVYDVLLVFDESCFSPHV